MSRLGHGFPVALLGRPRSLVHSLAEGIRVKPRESFFQVFVESRVQGSVRDFQGLFHRLSGGFAGAIGGQDSLQGVATVGVRDVFAQEPGLDVGDHDLLRVGWSDESLVERRDG